MEIVTPVFPGVPTFGETQGVFDIFLLEKLPQVSVSFHQKICLPDTDPEKLEFIVGSVKKSPVGLLIGIPDPGAENTDPSEKILGGVQTFNPRVIPSVFDS
jgi:hypothetical protein